MVVDDGPFGEATLGQVGVRVSPLGHSRLFGALRVDRHLALPMSRLPPRGAFGISEQRKNELSMSRKRKSG